MPSARKKCICQLCTCGRHMCPHNKKESHLNLGDGLKAEKSLDPELTRTGKKKNRKQWSVQNGKIGEKTSSTDQISAKLRATSLTVEDKGNSQSVNGEGKQWSAKQIPKTLPIKRPDNLKPEGKTDFTTLHQQDFTEKSTSFYTSDSAINETSAEIQEGSWNKRQIPKTQKIIKPDTLIFDGQLNLETTHKAAYNENVFHSKNLQETSEISGRAEVFQRPRTSLKLSGEFQTDSSYQRAFTPKKREDGITVKKGTSVSHLKPEGEMIFDRTSSDYSAVQEMQVSRTSDDSSTVTALKPKAARPQSEIKIPAVPLSNETTVVNDFKRWSVDKPPRYKPADTLQLGDPTETDSSNVIAELKSYTKADVSNSETTMSDYKAWQTSRPVIGKPPENNLKPEGDFSFTTTHDIDYSSSRRERARKRQSSLETLTERTERESLEPTTGREEISESTAAEQVITKEVEKRSEEDNRMNAGIMETEHFQKENALQIDNDVKMAEAANQTVAVSSPEISHIYNEDTDLKTQNEEQMQYLTWDQIRPKPIRPHSNLRQEGEMEFNTTNRSEFVERSLERVKGIRPQTTTKLLEGDFDGTTMNQVMFSHDQGEKVTPIRPKSNLHVEGGAFVDETTSSREFQQWHIKRPSPIVPRSNLTQEGTIDFTTTNQTEFEEKHPDKVLPIRPKTNSKIMSGDIDLTTMNRLMHSELPIERVQKIVPQSNLRMSSGAFSSETTNKTQFQKWEIDKPKQIKPLPNLKQEGAMDFMTMNQMQFEGKQLEKVTPFRPVTTSKISGEFDGTTTNQVTYDTKSLQRPRIIKTKSNLEVGKGKFANDTTNHSEFQQWQLSPSKGVAPKDNLQQGGDIDFSTTNQLQYNAKTIDRVSEIRPKTNSKFSGEFDDTTMNQVMFQNLPSEKSQAFRPQGNIVLEKGNFSSETTNSREFQTWDYSKQSPIKPHSSIRQEGDMDFTTTNNTQFEGKTAERVLQIRPITSTKITGDFDGTTTNQVMFQNNIVEKIKGKRPSTNIHLETGKFEDETTARREFQQKEITRSEAFRPSGNIVPEGKMDFMTSNRAEFEGKQATKVEPIRPHTTSPVTGDFDGTTTNQVMYQAQTIEKVHNIRPKDNLRVDTGEFNSETTASEAYTYRAGSKPEPIKPKLNLSQEGDFDFITSNQLQFEEKSIHKVTPDRPKTKTKMSEAKFHSTTTNQDAYQTPTMETVREIRPTNNLTVEGGKFQSSTTAADGYRHWETEKPKAFQLVSSLKQEGDMQFETTNSSEFKERSFDRVQQIRPKTTSKIEGDFEATTTNQVMFRQPEKLERAKPIRQENNLHVDSGKFSNETTTGREFRQWVKMEKKDSVSKRKSEPAGVRTYKENVQGKKEVQVKDKKATSSPEKEKYEPWQLTKDSTPGHTSSEKDRFTSRLSTGNIKSNDKLQHRKETASVRKESDSAQVRDTKSSPNGVKLEPVIMNRESSRSMEQCNGKEDILKDRSTTTTDYGTKQKIKEDTVTFTLDSSQEALKNTASKTTICQQGDFSDKLHSSENKLEDSTRSESWKLSSSATVKSEERVVANQGKKSVSKSKMNETVILSPVKFVTPKRFKPDDNLKLEHVPFEGSSTTRTEYKKWDVQRSSPIKRSENLKQEGLMEFNTTANDYSVSRSYQVNRESTKAKCDADRKGTLGQTGSMEFSTTSHTSYTGNAASRSKNLRPRSSLKLGVEEPVSYEPGVSSRSNPETGTRQNTEMTSTSRASYVGYTANRRTRANRPSTSQKIGQGSFEGQSTSRSSFTAPHEHVEKSRAIKPENHNILDTGNGFSGNTTYRSSFEIIEKHHCPVVDLQAGRSSLAFNEERNGHIFYAPRVQG